MANNTVLNVGTGGDTIQTIDNTTYKTQVVAVADSTGANKVTVNASGQLSVLAVGGAANGAAVSGNPVLIAGSDGTNARTFKTDSSGALTIIANQDARTSGTLTTAASTVGPVTVTNRNIATVTISGTYAGVTFIIEATDDGTNWYPTQSMDNKTGVASTTGAWTPGTNATASYDLAIGGYTQLRVRSTAWTSGTANIGVTLQTFAYEPIVASICQGATAAATTAVGNPVLVGGVFNSTLPTYTTGQAGQIQLTAKGSVLSTITDGTTTAAVIATTTALKTDLSSVAGTATVTGGVAGTQGIGGITAVNATSTGNPVYGGGIALVTANPTAATNGQRTGIATDKVGRQIVVHNHERTMTAVQQTTITSSVVETTIVTAGAAGVFNDLTHLSITNGSATATIVTLKDATAGTTRGIWNIAAGGGVVIPFYTPLAQATAANNWTITCGTSVASVYVVAQYVKNI